MRIVSWNINSVRKRAYQLPRIAESLAPDVICLQETRTPDSGFPLDVATELGYVHHAISGFKGRNGVAILSRLPFVADSVERITLAGAVATGAEHDETRHLAVNFANGVRLHNFYIPAGGDVPDGSENPKFRHKMQYVAEAAALTAQDVDKRTLLVGDFNIAPLPNDVWSHRQMLSVVSHTPVETEALTEWLDQGWTDTARHFVAEEEKLHTWWSYRVKEWSPTSRGLRLDHIWASPALKESLVGYSQFYAAREWPEPSDHIPIVVTLDLDS